MIHNVKNILKPNKKFKHWYYKSKKKEKIYQEINVKSTWNRKKGYQDSFLLLKTLKSSIMIYYNDKL